VDAPLASAYGFSLVLLRTAGLFVAGPLLASRVIPARIRLGLSLAVAFAVWQGAGAPAIAPPDHLGPLAFAAAAETALGLLAGLCARWVLEAALGAGHLAGLSTGVGFGAVVDPTTGADSNAVSELLFVGAQAAAIAAGLHREAIAWLARGVAAWPPGGPLPLSELATRATGQAVLAVALSVRMAFPVLAAVMLGYAVMGLLGRLAPQLSLPNIGFSLTILGGGLALYLAAPVAAELAAGAAVATFQR
jgi:flagellar biosynthetic protein FliR